MTFFTDLMEAIPAYTGLSPVAFFTIAALLITLYYLVSGFFAAPKLSSYRNVAMEPLPPPVQLGDVSEADLRAYDGTDPSKPLLMAIKGKIYDVSQSRMFYGPGGPYALFAGKDASRALAKMSFEEQDLTGDIEGLGAYELDALNDWEWKFMSKYVEVGQVVNENSKTRDVTVQDGTSVPKESKVVKGVDVDESKNTNEVDADANQVNPSEETAKSE